MLEPKTPDARDAQLLEERSLADQERAAREVPSDRFVAPEFDE